MRKEIYDAIITILTIVAIILAVYSIGLLIWKLFGHSPDIDTIVLWVIGVLLTLEVLIIGVLLQIKEDLGSMKEFRKQTITKIKEMEININKKAE